MQIEDKHKIKTILKRCTKALICSAQVQALRMDYTKFHKDKNHPYVECIE